MVENMQTGERMVDVPVVLLLMLYHITSLRFLDLLLTVDSWFCLHFVVVYLLINHGCLILYYRHVGT